MTRRKTEAPLASDEELWTAAEAAKFLKRHKETVYEDARAGRIPSVLIGRSRRFEPTAVRRWVQEQAS